MNKVSSIKKKLDINTDFLQQAWRNVALEDQSPLQDIVNFCHQQPLYHDYTDHLVNNGMDMHLAITQTETMAMGMINLLHNRHLEPETRQEIARSILLRLKFGFEMNKQDNEDTLHIHHEDLDITIPKRANDLIDLLIRNSRNAMTQYKENVAAQENTAPAL